MKKDLCGVSATFTTSMISSGRLCSQAPAAHCRAAEVIASLSWGIQHPADDGRPGPTDRAAAGGALAGVSNSRLVSNSRSPTVCRRVRGRAIVEPEQRRISVGARSARRCSRCRPRTSAAAAARTRSPVAAHSVKAAGLGVRMSDTEVGAVAVDRGATGSRPRSILRGVTARLRPPCPDRSRTRSRFLRRDDDIAPPGRVTSIGGMPDQSGPPRRKRPAGSRRRRRRPFNP